jgi:hypothetical protein
MYTVLIRVDDANETEHVIMQLIDIFKRYDIDPRESIATHYHAGSLRKEEDFLKLIEMLKYGDRGFVEHWITHSFSDQLVHQVKYMDKRRNADFSYALIVETPNEMLAVELKLAL